MPLTWQKSQTAQRVRYDITRTTDLTTERVDVQKQANQLQLIITLTFPPTSLDYKDWATYAAEFEATLAAEAPL